MMQNAQCNDPDSMSINKLLTCYSKSCFEQIEQVEFSFSWISKVPSFSLWKIES